MSLRARLEQDLRDSMRRGDAPLRSVMRYLRAEIRNEEIASQTDLDDDGITRVLGRQAQQRRDSIEAYAEGNRQDLVDKEKAELVIILEYLPEQMSAEEIARLVRQAVDEVGAMGPQDMGKVMGLVMPQVSVRAEGRQVSAIV